ncbi:MAG: M23 family metallopeptidase [Microbacteriaceae bacterium]
MTASEQPIAEQPIPGQLIPLTRRALRDRAGAPARPIATRAGAMSARAGAEGIGRMLRRRLFSAAALLAVLALAVGTSVPASAFVSGTDATSASGYTALIDGQTIVVDDGVQDAPAERAEFSSESAVEVQAAQSAASTSGSTFTPTTGSVRWPFPYATTLSDGFGYRVSPCSGCSTFHKGLDFTPGEGVPTYSIAAGVVESVIVSNSGLGNEVIIDHVIDGQHITSVYGHLESNSSPLKAGDTVTVGQLVGKVGSTGTVTGPNMHLEIHIEGVAVDPYAWLTENAR